MKNTIKRGDFMGTETEHMSLSQILNNFNQIIIPDVQRDYVMGSGGEKLIKLLTAMAESNEKKENFNFSCLVAYKDKDNNLYIYDGQQRLATLVCLCSYLNSDTEIQNLLKKFSFTKREVANDWLNSPTKIKENIAVDFTTYSLAQLIKEFNTQQIRINYSTYKLSHKITFKFIFEKMFFDMVLVNEISDAEQFFLDINDGLDLKSYEIYKAELYHHADKVLRKEDFKKFALKMENEWLKLFLKYRNCECRWVNGSHQNIVIHTEEEMLCFYLKYCFRMMWIEEKNNDKDYKESNVSWLTETHFKRIETITDAIVEKLNTTDINSQLTCISYSIQQIGQHWNIIDTNYIKMLDLFLKNLYKTDETDKDVVIWCYISNLGVTTQEDKLCEYLRFVKKLLNNNRVENKSAKMIFNNWGVEAKTIQYARYYVKGIPKYYLNESYDKECDKDFLNSIIVMNSIYFSGEFYIEQYIHKLNDNFLKEILKKEKNKQDSEQRDIIIKYESLPFINGLVDNFVEYKSEKCCLRKWATENYLEKLQKISMENYQYKSVLRYIYKNKLSIENCKIENVNIYWDKYTGNCDNAEGTLLVHTWCDLFTNTKGIIYHEGIDEPYNYLGLLPEGWINHQNYIIQPDDNIHTNVEYPKAAFAAGQLKFLFNLGNFYSNFSWISKSEGVKYNINGKLEDNLPQYLRQYNSENWVVKNLEGDKYIYFSDKEYINKILSWKYKKFKRNQGEDITQYLKDKQGWMTLVNMNKTHFFIKIKEV
jgi:hypothetical protein